MAFLLEAGSVGQRSVLQLENLGHAFLGQCQHGIQLSRLEWRTFGGTLHFDETTGAGHHHVQVGLGGGVFQVVQVQHRLALVHAHRHSGDHLLERVAALQAATLLDHFQRVNECNHGTGNGGSTRAAVGLDHVAVDVQGHVAQLGHVQGRAQRTADQALDFEGAAALLATAGFTLVTLASGARQHAVLGGQPTLALTLEEPRYAVFDADGADHLGIAKLDQYRSLGVFGVVAGDADRAELIGSATTWTFHRGYLYGGRKTAEHYRAASRFGARLKNPVTNRRLVVLCQCQGLGPIAPLRYTPAPSQPVGFNLPISPLSRDCNARYLHGAQHDRLRPRRKSRRPRHPELGTALGQQPLPGAAPAPAGIVPRPRRRGT